MHDSIDRLIAIEKEIYKKKSKANIIAVTKTFPISKIEPVINHGHIHFGENKVQESIKKWSNLKYQYPKIKLHMIGKLQTNKVKYVLPLFDYIHSLDSIKLAEKIANEQEKEKKKLKIFIQVNFEQEVQKNGISPDKLENFYITCKNEFDLDIIGLMCLPPKDLNVEKYFSQLLDLSKAIKVEELSMGMSNDYTEALKYRSTFLRIGSKIFGSRI